MRRSPLLSLLILILAISVVPPASAQSDEIRAATGLPIKIGEPAIWGKVTLRRLAENERRPSIFVSLIEGGTLIERIAVDNSGFYLFRRGVRGMASLILEVENNEVGRLPLSMGASTQIRQDFEVDWLEVKRAFAPGVVTAKETYSRSPEAARRFENAMVLVRDKKSAAAAAELQKVITADPKDYVAWTELGTIYFRENNLNDAEAVYFKAIELNKNYFIALLNLGKLYVAKQQPDNAVVVLSNAVKADAGSADAHHYLGEAYLQQKKGSMAVVHLNEAIKLAPSLKADLHLRLAALYDGAKMKDKAAAEYKLFLAKRPDYTGKADLEKYILENSKK